MNGNRPAPTRPWRATPADERCAARHAHLIGAGLEVIGEHGWARTTVRAVCRAAGLTERYFYEAFGDREHLLLEVYDAVRTEAVTAVVSAFMQTRGSARTRAHASIEAACRVLFDDPHKGRVLLLEASTDPVMQARRRSDLLEHAKLLADLASKTFHSTALDPVRLRLSSLALLGSLTELGSAFLAGLLDVSREQLVDYLTHHMMIVLRSPQA